jgi:DNA-binding NarL/FixJ family response regulator
MPDYPRYNLAALLPRFGWFLAAKLAVTGVHNRSETLATRSFLSEPRVGHVASRLDSSLTLTDRKIGILSHLASGLTISEIAAVLNISPDTVYEHIAAARVRLGARSNPELIRLALRHGFLSICPE